MRISNVGYGRPWHTRSATLAGMSLRLPEVSDYATGALSDETLYYDYETPPAESDPEPQFDSTAVGWDRIATATTFKGRLAEAITHIAILLADCHAQMERRWAMASDHQARVECLEQFAEMLEVLLDATEGIKDWLAEHDPLAQIPIIGAFAKLKHLQAARLVLAMRMFLHYETGETNVALAVLRDNPHLDVMRSTDRLKMHNMRSRIVEIQDWAQCQFGSTRQEFA